MKSKNHENLPLYGFIGSAFIIILGVIVFNHYWSSLGPNPYTSMLPPITKKYEEFKDYTTLIFALISAIGTILSSVLIILFYGAWKEQHNQTVYGELAKAVIIGLNEDLKQLIYISGPLRTRSSDEILQGDFLISIIQKITNLIETGHKTSSDTYLLFIITKDSSYDLLRNQYNNYFLRIQDLLKDKVEKPNVSVKDILDIVDHNMGNYVFLKNSLTDKSLSYLIVK